MAEGGTEMMRDFLAVEDVLQHRREQREKVSGKDKPFRVEFRFSGGTRSYQYFPAREDCDGAQDQRAFYGPTGRPSIEGPRSQCIQKRGPRGGWKRVAA